VRDGLVAGNGEVAAQRHRRLDLKDTHESSKAGETITE
jgi:hypothetical protein